MKKVIAILAAVASISGCAQSIPEISHYNGQAMTTQIKATPNSEWELLIDGDVVTRKKVNLFDTENVMYGSYEGDPVMVRMYYRSNGWTSTYVGDVFVNNQLIETLVIQ